MPAREGFREPEFQALAPPLDGEWEGVGDGRKVSAIGVTIATTIATTTASSSATATTMSTSTVWEVVSQLPGVSSQSLV